MAQLTKIEWCDHTFSPWEGCTKVSPGCLHCYAETRNARFGGGSAPNWGKGAPRRRTSTANWNLPLKWNRQAAEHLAAWQQVADRMSAENLPEWLTRKPSRPRVFCASLADWLDDEVPLEWLADLLTLIDHTLHLDWLLLTKRPQNFEKRMRQVEETFFGLETLNGMTQTGSGVAAQWTFHSRPPSNVWLGTTVEDQTRADERIPELLAIPAKIRFLSCEPLLGPVELSLAGIHWIIAGGESGPQARPMHPDWARSLRDQCQTAGVPFLFKQWGEYAPCAPPVVTNIEGKLQATGTWRAKDKYVECKDTGQWVLRVGKHTAGRLLDGIEHHAFPSTSPPSSRPSTAFEPLRKDPAQP